MMAGKARETKRVYDRETLGARADEINMLKNKKNYKMVTDIVERLKAILAGDADLIALSAPQIGYPYRIFCVKFSNDEIRGFVNPLIYRYSTESHLSREMQIGHNSSTEYIVPRSDEVEMSFQTPVGNLQSNLFKDVVGEVMQQMSDLLDGVMLEDYGLEVMEGFDEASQEERDEIIHMYIDYLHGQMDELQKDIEKDKDHARMNEAIDFMEQAKLGNIEVRFEERPEGESKAKPEAKKKKSSKKKTKKKGK